MNQQRREGEMQQIILKIPFSASKIRHYRFWDGTIACGVISTRIEATEIVRGVTCKRCLAWLRRRNEETT